MNIFLVLGGSFLIRLEEILWSDYREVSAVALGRYCWYQQGKEEDLSDIGGGRVGGGREVVGLGQGGKDVGDVVGLCESWPQERGADTHLITNV